MIKSLIEILSLWSIRRTLKTELCKQESIGITVEKRKERDLMIMCMNLPKTKAHPWALHVAGKTQISIPEILRYKLNLSHSSHLRLNHERACTRNSKYHNKVFENWDSKQHTYKIMQILWFNTNHIDCL